MNEREAYTLKRRQKKIRLHHIARNIGCSTSLLSRFETGDCEMSQEKKRKYKEFIDQFVKYER
ncbi:helix-turn-helix domain-containing protein [Brevibacillus fortis]|uniref:helix-turn-helix domain-containing protein n=1 Tax=Brevibacillus fortis TaxID=2126352 RepID=UPI0038FD0331